MTFKDIIKKSVLENMVESGVSTKEMLFLLAVAAGIGIFIFVIYRLICKGSFYSRTFNISLILLCVITATIIITIQTNIVVSLGMVGALSIVRFRTAIKNPMDLVFSFWAISVGIVVGAGLPLIACAMSLVIAVILGIFMMLPEIGNKDLLVSVQGDFETEKLEEIFKDNVRKYVKKSEGFSGGHINVMYEVKPIKDVNLIDLIRNLEGVSAATVVEHKESQF